MRSAEAALPIFDETVGFEGETTPAGAAADDRVVVNVWAGFEDFYAAEWTNMCRALTLALGDAALGTDAAAEGFTKACERWHEVSRYGNPNGWVYRVSLNWGRSWIRRRATERRRRARVRDGVHDSLPDPDLERAMAALSDDHRDVVVLRYFVDLSIAETADSLRIPQGTVKSRLARALDQLGASLSISLSDEDIPHDDTQAKDNR
jgi:RNA polymerase sigma factor (sigma-70 family)